MTRKQWLQKFLWYADNNRPAREYRAHLGIRYPDLKVHISKLQEYRNELKDIEQAEILERDLEDRERQALAETKEMKVEDMLDDTGGRGRGIQEVHAEEDDGKATKRVARRPRDKKGKKSTSDEDN